MFPRGCGVPMRKFREAGIVLGLFCFVCVLANADAKAQTLSFPAYNIALKAARASNWATSITSATAVNRY